MKEDNNSVPSWITQKVNMRKTRQEKIKKNIYSLYLLFIHEKIPALYTSSIHRREYRS